MKFMVYLLLVAILGISGAVGYQFEQISQARADAREGTCMAFRNYNAFFAKQTRTGEAALPGLTYYKQHPDELAKVIALDETFVRNLAANLPPYC